MKLSLYLLLSLYNNYSDLGKDWNNSYVEVIESKIDSKITSGTSKLELELKLPDDCANGVKIQYKIDDGGLIVPALDKNKKFAISIKSGKHKIYFYAQGCSNAISDTIDFKSQSINSVVVHFSGIQAYTFKPVIYLYPEEETKVNVKFDYNGELEFTYPQYPNEGWNVNAFPDGTLEVDNKKYNYLFWDGKMDTKLFDIDKSEGSIIKSSELVSFFENSLTDIGLNTKEIQDFITFWAPKMMNNEQNYIHFLFTNDYDQVSTIKVKPRPDNKLRLYMLWSDATGIENIVLTEQMFPEFKRKGFTLVEWGGSEIPNLLNNF